MKICFATNNQNKIKEVRALLGDQIEVLGLAEIGCDVELPENQDTLEGNSLEKAQYVTDHFHVNCFADDTGLEVEVLAGAPGVYSARYAGPECKSENNIALLLEKLEGEKNRNAQFRTIVSLLLDGEVFQFEGKVEGVITETLSGLDGFGYDPIFIPENRNETFAEMPLSEKNKISHRARAFQKLITFLKKRD